ncbi:MAG: cyclic nucleotide-binding domain-containing protein, partial [Cyanobacteria bacterium P01_G01_bin.38]
GTIAQLMAAPSSLDVPLAQTWPPQLDGTTARIITRIVVHSDTPALIPLISRQVLTQSNADIIRVGLEALLPLTQRGDQVIAAIACDQLAHADSMVRMAAYDLLRVTGCADQLTVVGEGLGDPDPRVRQQAARALAAYGRPGLALAKKQLSAPRPEIVDTAITVIGLVRTKYASNLLFDYLAPSYKQLSQTRKWQQQIPTDAPGWEPLKVAIVDYHERLIQRVLYVLSALGYARTVNSVNRLLVTPNQHELENAIEVLASLNHRRFVLPLIPLFEERIANEPSRLQASPQWFRAKGYRLLLEALESKDRWIRTGALIALSRVPSVHINDPDPFVKQIASQIFGAIDPSTPPVNTAMNRLLLLKKVALFKNLSLDELLLIDKSLEQTQVLAGETIFTEGEWEAHLYIIAEGTVQLVKAIDNVPRELNQLSQGQYFGEVALFDDAPRWDSAVALEDCTLFKLEKNRFLSLVTQRPHIILEICRFLTQRLRETDRHRSALAASVEKTESTNGNPLPS